METINTGAKQGVASALVGVLISLTNAFIQFLMIYWILSAYGTQFNGFIKITIALSILGGSAEGALAISTVILLMKPIAQNDWISANEIYSTARRKYHRGMTKGFVLITLISVLYPMQIILFPHILGGTEIPPFSEWGIEITGSQATVGGIGSEVALKTVAFWQMILIVMLFGFKQVFTVGFFGVYENIIQADQKNGLRRIIILLTDVIVYGILFVLLNISISGTEPLNPIIPFIVLIAYPIVRGTFIMIYVRRFYPWLKYFGDFNNFKLSKSASRLFLANLGQNILMNSDLIILMVVLGTSGLQITSMLSLYMVIAVNLRLVMTNFITSFREYFLAVTIKEGRLSWEAFSKYELYTYVIAAFTFILMSTLGPYIVTGLYGQTIVADLNSQSYNFLTSLDWANLPENSAEWIMGQYQSTMGNQYQAAKFIFSSPWFSLLYSASMVVIILFQSQITLIQAKGVNTQVTRGINIVAALYLVTTGLTAFLIYIIKPDTDPEKIKTILITFYAMKTLFIGSAYIYLWFYTWRKVTYNSTFKSVFSNFLSLIIPIALSVMVTLLLLWKSKTVQMTDFFVMDGSGGISVDDITITKIGAPTILWVMVVTAVLGFAASIVVPSIIRPKVALSLILNLPIIKQIIERQKEESKIKRLLNEDVDIDVLANQKDTVLRAINGFNDMESEIDQEEFIKKYKFKEKPKVYKIKGTKAK